MTSYTALLKLAVPFSTYNELLQDNEYKVAFLMGGMDEALLVSKAYIYQTFNYKAKN